MQVGEGKSGLPGGGQKGIVRVDIEGDGEGTGRGTTCGPGTGKGNGIIGIIDEAKKRTAGLDRVTMVGAYKLPAV